MPDAPGRRSDPSGVRGCERRSGNAPGLPCRVGKRDRSAGERSLSHNTRPVEAAGLSRKRPNLLPWVPTGEGCLLVHPAPGGPCETIRKNEHAISHCPWSCQASRHRCASKRRRRALARQAPWHRDRRQRQDRRLAAAFPRKLSRDQCGDAALPHPLRRQCRITRRAAAAYGSISSRKSRPRSTPCRRSLSAVSRSSPASAEAACAVALPLDEVIYVDVDVILFRDFRPLFGRLEAGQSRFHRRLADCELCLQ